MRFDCADSLAQPPAHQAPVSNLVQLSSQAGSLPEVLDRLRQSDLCYLWMFSIRHSESYSKIDAIRVLHGFKPILAFCRPPRTVWWEWFRDVTSGGRQKTDHPWQQAVDEAAHFIRHLCPDGGTVVDPMCGSGTTLVAAKQLGRRWRGYEIDPQHAETARIRLDETPEVQR